MVNSVDRIVWYKNLGTWHKNRPFSMCVHGVVILCFALFCIFEGFFFVVDWGVFCVNLFYILLNPTIVSVLGLG